MTAGGNPTAGRPELVTVGREIVREIRRSPGVVAVFRSPSTLSRWFGEAPVSFEQRGEAVVAVITIGVDGDLPRDDTAHRVKVHCYARLIQSGYLVAEVRVHVALIA